MSLLKRIPTRTGGPATIGFWRIRQQNTSEHSITTCSPPRSWARKKPIHRFKNAVQNQLFSELDPSYWMLRK